MLKYQRIGVMAKLNLAEEDQSIRAVLEVLLTTGAEVFIDPASLENVAHMQRFPHLLAETIIDLIVVIGGDGTLLRSVRQNANRSIPLLGIHKGVLGFLAEVNMDEIETLIPSLLSGEGIIDERRMLDVTVTRGNSVVFLGTALNEAVIAQGTIARLLDLKTEVSGEALATFHADGLIVATPTGSTAYALAAGGPIVHPKLSALILAPINPHSLTQKPVVISGDSLVTVEVIQTASTFHDTNVGLTLDGQVYFELMGGDAVSVHVSETPARFLRRPHDRFFFTLRSKLRWGDGV